GINLATNRPTTIKAGTKMTAVQEAAEPEAPAKPAVAATGGKKGKSASNAPAVVPDATGANVPPSEAKRKPGKGAGAGGKNPLKPGEKKQRPAQPERPKRRGALDLAAELLAQSPEPMTTAALVTVLLERKLWFTNGKTPAATLYAAIIREISAKGKDSRFVKTARGLFAATGK
ncbi:MAG: winged helix-turn-helix domain-containing protein, partial [Phycisphaerales bacterium]